MKKEIIESIKGTYDGVTKKINYSEIFTASERWLLDGTKHTFIN